ncbi:hypothetical protein PENSPDRAFT_669256 [Peniophora sp. CONT]|nr:hypothetical protein PENSPDRAFT_669256 [Peniophora sp. CONT]
MPPRARPIVKGVAVSSLRSDSESPPPLRRRSQTLAEEWGHSDEQAPGVKRGRASVYPDGEASHDEADSPLTTPYKAQGRTHRAPRSSRYAQDGSDEDSPRSNGGQREAHVSMSVFFASSWLPFTNTHPSPRGRLARKDRARFAVSDESDGERMRSGRSDLVPGRTSGKAVRTPDFNRDYLSPPPTQRKLRVPDTPRGRVPRRPTGRSSDAGHDVYDMRSSDEDAVVRVRAKDKKPLPAPDVVDISSDEDMPTRLTTPRKLKFSSSTREDPLSNDDNITHTIEDDEDADENGNLRGFIVSDDDDVLRSPSRRERRQGVRGLPKKNHSDTPATVDGETDPSSRSHVQPPGDLQDGSESRARPSEAVKRKARSLSRESDDYRPAQKRSSRTMGDRDSAALGSGRIVKRRERSTTPLLSEDARPVKRRVRAPAETRRSPSPAMYKGKNPRRRNRSLTPYDSDDVKPAKRAKKEVAAQMRRSPSVDVVAERRKRKDRSPTPSDGEDAKNTKRPKKSSAQTSSSPSAPKAGRSSTKPSGGTQSTNSLPLVKDGKCKITFEHDHDGFLVGTYDDCVAYLSSSMLRTPQETGAVGVSHFGSTRNGLPMFEADNLCTKRLRALISLATAADGQIISPARADPDRVGVGLSDYTTQNNKTIKSVARKGENVDLVVFAFVAPDGSFLDRLASPSGANAPTNQCYHALHVYPLNGDYQRILAFLHRTYAPANQQCQMFTTGNAWQATTLWGDRDKYQQKKPLPGHVRLNPGESSSARGSRGVNPALSRVAKNYMADIPVFDSRRHFMLSHVGENWEDGFSPERILTQVDGLDERFQGEIPDDSFIAMHCVSSMRANGVVSLNLIGAQVLVTPRVVHFSDL